MFPLRKVPPAAASVRVVDALRGCAGLVAGSRFLARLEAEARAELQFRHVFFLSSGRAAFAVVLQALRTLSSRREVVVPAYTCFSVPAAIERAGLVVVPCDVDPERLDFDMPALERAVTSDTLCVVPSHLFGIPSDLGRVLPLARERGAFVVEDAAQAMGVRLDGRPLGTLGDVGFFSFDRGKSVTCGAGGMIGTSSDRIAGAVRRAWERLPAPRRGEAAADVLRVLSMAVFIRPWLYWIPAALPWLGLGRTTFDPGFPIARMSGTKAAMLTGWRRRLVEGGRVRTEAAAYYRRHSGSLGFGSDAGPHIRWPVLTAGRQERDRILRAGRQRGLGIGTMYPSGIDGIPALGRRLAGSRYPGATAVSERLVTLPTHRFASERVRRAIVQTIVSCGEGKASCPATVPQASPSAAAGD